MSVLVVIAGPDRGKVFELDRDVINIGRDESNTICLTDPQVSRHHAQMVRRGEVYHLIDLDSRNGTFVDGKRVEACRLRPGNVVRMGRTSLALADSPEQVRMPQPGEAPVRIVTDQTRVDQTIHARRQSRSGDTDAIVAHAARAAVRYDPTTQAAIRNLRVLYQIATAVGTTFELDHLLDKVLEIVFTVLPAERGFVVLLDPETGALRPHAVRTRGTDDEVTISRTIVNYCIQREEGVLTSNAMSDDRFESGQSVLRLGIRSAICVPIRSRRRVLGAIGVDARISTCEFTEADLNLMTAIGNQVGVVVENAQLIQENIRAERLAAIGEAVASLSHYIKNILQGLQGGSTLIQTGLEEDDPDLVRRGWLIVDKSQRKVAKLVKDMLTYAGRGQPNRRPVDLAALLEETIEFARSTESAEGVLIQRRCDPNLPRKVMLDPDALTDCLLNIILNALDAVAHRPNPTVQVTAERSPDGKNILIRVTDNGVGIPPEMLPTIFNALTTTKGGRGTGLGLAVARKIAREHGGDISVSSQPGKGSTFTVSLPLITPDRNDHHQERKTT